MTYYFKIDPLEYIAKQIKALTRQHVSENRVGKAAQMGARIDAYRDSARWVIMAEREKATGEHQEYLHDDKVMEVLRERVAGTVKRPMTLEELGMTMPSGDKGTKGEDG